MRKIILSKAQVFDLVRANKYRVKDEVKLLSRCVDGRYPTSLKLRGASENLPPLALPGADAGELALILSVGNTYGFEVDKKKVLKVLFGIVGGVKNFNFHSDEHGDAKIPASGCGHVKQLTLDPKAYNLEEDQVEFIKKSLIKAKKQGTKEIVLEGDHQEGAILQVKGDYSVYPRFSLELEEGREHTQAFIFHATLVNERHKLLAKKLIEEKAVKLFAGCDEEYLYEVFSEVTENHLFETLKRLASGLPIFQVSFAKDGSFEIIEMGRV